MFLHKVIRNHGLGKLIAGFFVVCLVLNGAASVATAAKPDFEPVTLCHQEGNGTYHDVTVSTEGALNGHQGHEGDVIPAPEAGCESLNPQEEVVIPTADVQITKTADTATKHEGDTVTYTLTAHNNGPATAADVVVNDVLPSTLTFVSATPPADYNSGTGVWTVGTLANGADSILTITATVTGGTAGTDILNTATITASTVDSNQNNNSNTSTVSILVNEVVDEDPGQENGPCVSGPAHAEVVVSSAQGTLNNGDAITDVTRTNPSNALGAANGSFFSLGKQGTVTLSFSQYVIDVPGTDISVHEITNGRDTYPEERADVAVSQDGVTWINVGTASGLDLGTGVSEFDFSGTGYAWIKYVRISDATNFAIHDGTADGYDLDAVDATYKSCIIITLEKEGVYNSGTGTLTYTIDWAVVGEGSTDVTITDQLPSGTTYVPASADNGGVYNGGTETITWVLGNHAAGDSGSVSFMATLDAALALNQWASTVVSFAQGKQANLVSAVDGNRSDPAQALGVAQTVGSIYDNPLPDFIGKFVSLGFTDQPTGGELVLAFDQPLHNGTGPDVKVFEVTGGDNYPDEHIKVSVSNDNSTWSDVGVVIRDGTVDLGANPYANYLKLTDTSDKNAFESTADGFDVDAVQALQLVPPMCSVTNVAEATFNITVNEVIVPVTTTAQTTTTIDAQSCEEGSFKISGQKWNDINGNGTQDEGDSGLANWVIYIDTNNNGALDQSEPNTTTDQSGNYMFPDLAPGMYVVREVGKAGWTQTYPAVQSFGKHVVFVSDFDVTGKTFGNHQTPDQGGGDGNTGSITGLVFNDANNNATLDEGEASLSGWVVYLDTNDNGSLDGGEASATTASPYLFSNLADGTYTVREIVQANWAQTLPTSTDSFKYVVNISGGNAVTGKNFGNFQTQGGGGSSGGGGGSSTTTSGGGGGGGAGGGSGGTLGAPTGQVLGDSTTSGTPPTSVTDPINPQVLGEVTELPRTGAGAAHLLVSFLLGLLATGYAYKKLQLKN